MPPLNDPVLLSLPVHNLPDILSTLQVIVKFTGALLIVDIRMVRLSSNRISYDLVLRAADWFEVSGHLDHGMTGGKEGSGV